MQHHSITPKMELSMKTPRSVELDVLNASPAAHDNSDIYFYVLAP